MNDYERDQRYILNTYNKINLDIKKAKGSYLIDIKGNRYLDMYAGIAVNSLGHQHPKINRAIKTQLKKHMHLSNYFLSKSTIDLAEKLVQHSFASKVFFTNSGTEAIEASLKIARKYGQQMNPEKIECVALNQSFHGRTLGALSLTGQSKYQHNFGPLIEKVFHVDRNDIEGLRKSVSNKTCAIYLEVIQGEGGIQLLSDAFIEEVNHLAKAYNALIVIDEIQTGLLRTGKLFAYEHTKLKPDMLTLAKSLGGGLPLGALLVSENLKEVLAPGDHGTTFGGNPLACSAGLEMFHVLSKQDFQISVEQKSQFLLNELNKMKENSSTIKDIRGKGLMIGIEVGSYAHMIQKKALEQKLLLNLTNQTVIRLLPPLNISYASLKQFLRIFEKIILSIDSN